MSSLSAVERDVSHIINGLLSFSVGQSLPLNKFAFSNLNFDNISEVTCRLGGDSLLCSNKNCCLLLIRDILAFFPKKSKTKANCFAFVGIATLILTLRAVRAVRSRAIPRFADRQKVVANCFAFVGIATLILTLRAVRAVRWRAIPRFADRQIGYQKLAITG